MMDDTDLARAFDDIADTEPPASSIDVGHAIATGRRAVRTRRTLTAGMALAAVASMTFAIAAGAQSLGALSDNGGGSRSAAGSSDGTARSDEAPKRFDPTVQYATFGWLPSGETRQNIAASATDLELMAMVSWSTEFRLCVVTAGHGLSNDVPPVSSTAGNDGCNATSTATPASSFEKTAPVNGHTAGWVTKVWDHKRRPVGKTATLQWEYAPGAWAELSILRGGGADPRPLARRVAEQVKFGANAPISLPAKLSQPPSGLHLGSILLERYRRPIEAPAAGQDSADEQQLSREYSQKMASDLAYWRLGLTFTGADTTKWYLDPVYLCIWRDDSGHKTGSIPDPKPLVVNGFTVTQNSSNNDGGQSLQGYSDTSIFRLEIAGPIAATTPALDVLRAVVTDPAWK